MIAHNRIGEVVLPVAAFVLLGLLLGPTAQADLIGQWTFNEGSGTTALDSTANRNNGDIKGGPSYVASPGGFAISLEGKDESLNGDWVDFGDLPLFRLTGARSLEAWFMPAASQMGHGCDSEIRHSCKDFEILGRGWGNYALRFETSKHTGGSKDEWERTNYGENGNSCGGNAAGYQFETATCTDGPQPGVFQGTSFAGPNHQGPNDIIPLDPFQGTWRHVVAVSDPSVSHEDGGARTLMYIDGAEINGFDAIATSTDNAPRSFSAGSTAGSDTEGTHWIAMIDELRVYDHYLSAEEIMANFQAGPVPEPATLGLLGLGSLLMLKRRR